VSMNRPHLGEANLLAINERLHMVPPTVAGVDPERFVRLFVEGQREILRYILRLVPDIDAAHEILQDTAVDLWRKFDRYDPTFAFAPWACGFAFRRVLKHREQQARRVKHLSIESLNLIAAERSEKDGLLEDRRRALEKCLQQLRDDDRLVVEHRYSRQMSVAKIAGTTGRNTSALYKTLERIRRQLFECVNRRLQMGCHR
jgi:RNA polymerase sigma-70 factor, ECF subfamily